MRNQHEVGSTLDRALAGWRGGRSASWLIQGWADRILEEPEKSGRGKAAQSQEGGERNEKLLVQDVVLALQDPEVRLINLVGMDEDYLISGILSRAFSQTNLEPNLTTSAEFSYPHYTRDRSGRYLRSHSRIRAESVARMRGLPDVLTSLSNRTGATVPVVFLPAEVRGLGPEYQGASEIPQEYYHDFLQAGKGKVVLVSRDPVHTGSYGARIEVIEADDYDGTKDAFHGLVRFYIRDKAMEKGIIVENATETLVDDLIPFVEGDAEGNYHLIPASGPQGWYARVAKYTDQLSSLGNRKGALKMLGVALDNAYVEVPVKVGEVEFPGAFDLGYLGGRIRTYHQKETGRIMGKGEGEGEVIKYEDYAKAQMDPQDYQTVPGTPPHILKGMLSSLQEAGVAVDIEQVRRDYGMNEEQARAMAERRTMVPPFNILYGPVGMGKTMMARVAMHYLGPNYTLVHLDLRLVRARWYGEAERRLDRALRVLSQLRDSVLLIDEADTFFRSSESSTDVGKMEEGLIKTVQTWIENNLAVLKQNNVLVFMTTNNIEAIPDAVRSRAREGTWGFPGLLGDDVPRALEGAFSRLKETRGRSLSETINSFPESGLKGSDLESSYVVPGGVDFRTYLPNMYGEVVRRGLQNWYASKMGERLNQFLSHRDMEGLASVFLNQASQRAEGFAPSTLYYAFLEFTPAAATGETMA